MLNTWYNIIMIRYNWQKIRRLCDYDNNKILQYFFLKRGFDIPLHLGIITRTLRTKAKLPIPKGNSFLINLDGFLEGAEFNLTTDMINYLNLASMRSLFDYKIRGITYLPLAFVETGELDIAKNNPMLNIIDDNIFFYYEEQEKTDGY